MKVGSEFWEMSLDQISLGSDVKYPREMTSKAISRTRATFFLLQEVIVLF